MYGSSKTKVIISSWVIAIVILTPSLQESSFAHGPPPRGCAIYHGVEYPATITSFVVDNGQQEYDVLTDANTTIPVTRKGGFSVRSILHSDQNGFAIANGTIIVENSSESAGYIWYRDFANGYPFSKCAGPIQGDENLALSESYPTSHMFVGEGPHYLFFETTLDDSRPKAEFFLRVVDALGQSSQGQDQDATSASSNEESDEEIPDKPVTAPTETDIIGGNLSADAMILNGTIASFVFPVGTNVSELAQPPWPPYLAAGIWVMTVNGTAVVDFQSNITTVRADGIGRGEYSLANFAAVNSSHVRFDGNTILIVSTIDVMSPNSTSPTNVNMTLTLESLSVIRLYSDSPEASFQGLIFGVVDTVVLTRNGQETLVISR
ncbi:MAG: hypothetical protein MN733_17360 [Nitrososphaera sp.]|nr:hypothetical protein [Nitrososphaera sp.]